MSPTRDHGRGTFPLDRQIKGIGRIRRASGTTDSNTFDAIKAMFVMLKKKGRLDIIRAIHEGIVTPLDVYDRYITEKLDKLPSAETMRRLWPRIAPDDTVIAEGALESWRLTVKGTHHARAIGDSWRALRKLSKEDASIGDVAALLKDYSVACALLGHGASFRNTRNHVRAFLRDTVGTTHHLYQSAAAMPLLAVARQPGRPFTARSLFQFLPKMEREQSMPMAMMARSLALSGMRPVEYWGEWEYESPHVIRVRNAKKRAGQPPTWRRVPVVALIVKPSCHRRTFENAMRAVTRAHAVYDLRRTFMHLLEQAKVLRSRRMYYMGHAASDVSALYEEHEVTEYLERDYKRLRAYLARWEKN